MSVKLLVEKLKTSIGEGPGHLVNLSQMSQRSQQLSMTSGDRGFSEVLGLDSPLSPDFELNEKGKAAYEALESNSPFVFLTGRAGTGKTSFIEYVRSNLKKKIAVIAPTGIAALTVKGTTIHKFFRFPPRFFESSEIKTRNDTLIKRLELLIIDEISMVRADLIDHMDAALRKWRKNDQPFGGVQILVSGDLLQLPPVMDAQLESLYEKLGYASAWFYDAHVFQDLPVYMLELDEVYRQKEPHFAELLSKIRSNEYHRDAVAEINRCCFRDVGEFQPDLWLMATNRQAERANSREYQALQSEERVYESNTKGEFSLTENRLPAPASLHLKVGAQVMVTKNIAGAVNGTLGIVEALFVDSVMVKSLYDGEVLHCTPESWEQYQYSYDEEKKDIVAQVTGRYKQIPLVWGWAVTIHKSQGLTLDSVGIDLGRGAFVPGQTYVALSRCRTLSGIRLSRPISMGDVRADANVLSFYQEIESA